MRRIAFSQIEVQAPRIRRAVLAITLAAAVPALAGLAAGPANAQAHSEEDDTFEQGLIRQFMRGLGLKDSAGNGIQYRERAPLVLPSSTELPPPETTSAASQAANWPVDQDARRRAEVRRNTPRHRGPQETMEAEMRPLPQSEIDKGRVAATRTPTSSVPQVEGDRVKPSELGYSGGLFGNFFGKLGPQKEEQAVFRGEPTRQSLTMPPAGYLTPSPAQPYGTGVAVDPNARANAALRDRAAGDIQYPQ